MRGPASVGAGRLEFFRSLRGRLLALRGKAILSPPAWFRGRFGAWAETRRAEASLQREMKPAVEGLAGHLPPGGLLRSRQQSEDGLLRLLPDLVNFVVNLWRVHPG